MANANVPAKIFSADWKSLKADLGFKPDGKDPVVIAIARLQDSITVAARLAQDKRKSNPHEDVPLPKTAEEIVIAIGDAGVKPIREAFSEVFKFARYFRGSRFPLFIEGRDESPYSALVEGFLRDPKLVGIEQDGFTSVEHFGHPFQKRETATA